MIRNVQIEGEPDPHPERQVHDARELATGKINVASLPVSGHFIRVFDLFDEGQRREFERLYVDLVDKVRRGTVLISENVRESVTRQDGSTGWLKYIEWTEFDTSDILGA